MSEPHALIQKTIAGAADGPHVLITAGVHGDEFEPMHAVRQLIRSLPGKLLRGRVTLVPVVNEPAFARKCRTAEDRLDLARTCPGRADGSITERIAAALSSLIRTADYYLDLHTSGSHYEILPLAGYVLHSEEAVLNWQRRMARAFGLSIVWGTSARLQGRSLSVARDARVPAIYVEYGGGGPFDPVAAKGLENGCLNVLALLGLLPARPAADAVRYFVEDDRDQSGHLQVQNVAPGAGFFQSAVHLGQVVHRGEPLGWIVDPLGESQVPCPAGSDGLVLFLRVMPSVIEGDPVAAILPIVAPGQIRFTRGEVGESF